MNCKNPAWLENGMSVWIWWSSKDEHTALLRRCTVVAVEDVDHARIVNAELRVDLWYSICDLYVPHDWETWSELQVIQEILQEGR